MTHSILVLNTKFFLWFGTCLCIVVIPILENYSIKKPDLIRLTQFIYW